MEQHTGELIVRSVPHSKVYYDAFVVISPHIVKAGSKSRGERKCWA